MNQEKIGKFICKCRKNKNMTQQDLAELLGVSDRTIGNWENGRNMPDLALFKPLCDELDITLNDLMSGEVVSKKEYQEKLEENIVNTINFTNKKIKDKVIVQAGCTKYESKNMEIFDLIPSDKFEQLITKCDLLITHGGVGSILSGLLHEKIVIAAPRLAKYNEHVNDHQLQIIENLGKKKYILVLKDFTKIGKILEKAKDFKPKKFVSNTENIIKNLEDYIDSI